MNRINRETIFVTTVILYFISYTLDRINGPLKLAIKNPYAFVQPKILATYPFTGVSILLKVIALWLTVLLFLGLIEKRYLFKIIIVLTTAFLSQLYAIQQLATGLRVTPVEWTLAITFAGLLLVPTSGFFLFASLFSTVKSKTSLPQKTISPDLPRPKHLTKPSSPKSFEL